MIEDKLYCGYYGHQERKTVLRQVQHYYYRWDRTSGTIFEDWRSDRPGLAFLERRANRGPVSPIHLISIRGPKIASVGGELWSWRHFLYLYKTRDIIAIKYSQRTKHWDHGVPPRMDCHQNPTTISCQPLRVKRYFFLLMLLVYMHLSKVWLNVHLSVHTMNAMLADLKTLRKTNN